MIQPKESVHSLEKVVAGEFENEHFLVIFRPTSEAEMAFMKTIEVVISICKTSQMWAKFSLFYPSYPLTITFPFLLVQYTHHSYYVTLRAVTMPPPFKTLTTGAFMDGSRAIYDYRLVQSKFFDTAKTASIITLQLFLNPYLQMCVGLTGQGKYQFCQLDRGQTFTTRMRVAFRCYLSPSYPLVC